MPADSPLPRCLHFALSFDLPFAVRPITRYGQLVIHDDGTGCIIVQCSRLHAGQTVPLSREDVHAWRRLMTCWLALPSSRASAPIARGD